MFYKLGSAAIAAEYALRGVQRRAPEVKQALYLGWLGHKNLGDEALYYSISDILRGSCEFLDSSRFNRVPHWIRSLRRFDYAVLGGGTLINRSDAVLEGLKRLRRYAPERFVFSAGVANDEFWRQFEPRPDRSQEWKEFLAGCRFVGVRGPYSLKYLVDLGITSAQMVGDAVLHLGDVEITRKRKDRLIGVNIGWTDGRLWGKSDESLAETVAAAVDRLLCQGWKVSFVNVYAADLAPLNRLLAARKWQGKVRVLDFSNGDWRAALQYFRELDVFVGEKLHASVFSACAYTPFLSLEYRPKCRDFCASVEWEQFNVRTDRLDTDAILDAVNTLYGEQERWQKHLHERVSHYKLLQARAAAELFGTSA